MTDASPDQMEPDSTVYKTLLESTKAIPWKIDWSTMKFAYIGPQIEELLGWTPESWQTADDWAMRIHAEDREAVVNFCISQSKSGVDHEADYRALTRDGEHVWIRDVVHVVRNPDGSPNALIGFMFDITERKKTEARLIELQKELEALSYRDGLTNVANRRMFDSALEVEWANAINTRTPLSLIMLDIDYFKQYNDTYGHIRGDECLKQVAETLSKAATRTRDFFARYGGEEFVLILPEADEKAALQVAQRCRKLVLDAAIPHEKSQVADTVTISIGVTTIIPSTQDHRIAFLERVDQRLYKAKQLGRNCIAVDE
ncbi:MAG: Phytochrome-like protein cph2 [Herbaspirillum frisingense]|uniref:diguanylate cyclase n=1 Tax=Herbaspirillum frisingense TaxID=92645 RepID=A0A7V8FWX9_9BURK|nr:MAG: Phytochrome-like protein cph2 [Herbaspirillum frisingense]